MLESPISQRLRQPLARFSEQLLGLTGVKANVRSGDQKPVFHFQDLAFSKIEA